MSESSGNILEIGLGALFAIGALSNLLYADNHGEQFYESFAEGAVIKPMQRLIREIIIPNAKALTLLLVTFQVLVSLSLLSRAPFAVYGLVAGAVFCLVVASASNLQGAIANLLLAAT